MNAAVQVPMRQRAYTSFTEKLLSRDILPGQIVSQRQLVELTGMPLGAVREMIPRLEADGLIRTVPKKGLQITTIDLDLVRNAFQLRMVLEREAFQQYCRRAPDAEIAHYHTEHSDIRSEARAGVTPDVLDRAQRLDWSFHDHVVDALGNDLISNIYRVNTIKIRLIRGPETRMLPELVVSVLDEHMRILDALKARDAAAVEDAAMAHIESAWRRALGI